MAVFAILGVGCGTGNADPRPTMTAEQVEEAQMREDSALFDEVYQHLERLDKTGKLDDDAWGYIRRLENAKSPAGRAKLAAILGPAYAKKAISRDEAVEILTRMADKAPTEHERELFQG
ncbi:MAG: hypothetical protein MH204_03110, partial [Fimbriimonadaceae bacterium]|nr:hypothetical protein [Fimbriimonadaceae bacterium]